MGEPITPERLAAAGFAITAENGASLIVDHQCIDAVCDDGWLLYATDGSPGNVVTLRPRDMDDVRRLVAMMGMEVEG